VGWYFHQVKTKPGAVFFQQFIIAFAVPAKAMVVPNDNGVWMEFLNQEFLDILLGALLRKIIGKGYHYQVIDAVFMQQLNFFVDGIDEVNGWLAANDHFARVGVKGNDNRFAANAHSLPFQLLQNALVAGMHPIECAYRNYSLFKGRYGFS
jgi:hypothetical protein